MPCTRSMRSQSKPSGSKKKPEEEEMPPPSPPSTPPKAKPTRPTRAAKTSKKVNKAVEEPVEEPPKSPVPTTSTRPKRSRARPTKASSPPPAPPPTRATRSTRQKTKDSKPAKVKTPPEETDDSSDEVKQEDSPPPPSKSKPASSRSTAKKTTKTAKPKRKAKAGSKAQVSLEPMSDPDMSAADEDRVLNSKQIKSLDQQQLHKYHATTVKTAFGLNVCEVVPKYMQKIMDPEARDNQEKEFQELLNAPEVEMPPPPPPQGNTKRRVKRVRSPDPAPAKSAESAPALPQSFDFEGSSDTHTPAKKRLMVEVEIPPPPVTVEETETAASTSASSVAEGKVEENTASTTESSDSKLDSEEKEQDTAAKSKEKLKKKKKLETNTKQKKPKTKGKAKEKDLQKEEGLEVSAPAPTPIDNLVELSNKKPEEEQATNEEVAEPVLPHKNASEGKAVLVNQAESNDDFLEQSIMEICQTGDVGIPTTEAKPAAVIKDEDKLNVKEPVPANDKKSSLVKEQKEKNSELLNGTYVLETPKDNRKGQELKKNTEFTPELFQDTPKAADATFDKPKTKTNLANQTVTISSSDDDEMDKKNDNDAGSSIAQPAVVCEDDSTSKAGNNGSGFVSSLVSFFSKNKTDEAKLPLASTTTTDVPPKSRSPSAELVGFTPDKPMDMDDDDAGKNNMNSTFVLPPAAKSPKTEKKKQKPSSLLNVTVCLKKGPQLDEVMEQQRPVPILPPPTFYQQMNKSGPLKDNPCSRTFIKEPSGLDVVVEEDDDGASSTSSEKPSTGKNLAGKVKPVVSKHVSKDKESKKGTSSSSSNSSTSSLKSASSQPCLLSSGSKKAPIASSKGSSYGSTGKLNEVFKSNPLEEAEKRRREINQQKADLAKKKMDEWKKKTEKVKLEEEKKTKEKQKFVHPSTSAGILKKPAPILNPPKPGFAKPKFNFGVGAGPSGSKLQSGGGNNFVPPLSKQPYHVKPPPPPPVEEAEMDESFKSANASNSFLDVTVDGPLSSYDITRYEDLDDDLKHRENKTVPTWASDKESLKVALFSMVYLPEYQQSLHLTFPKPDRSYKLFPPRMIYN